MKGKLNKKQISVILSGVILIIAIIAGTAVAVLKIQSSGKPGDNSSSSVSGDRDSDKNNGSSGSDDTAAEDSSDRIYISDCDSIDKLEEQENIQLVTDEGMYKQGKGAFLNSSTSPIFFKAKLKQAVDISSLKGGYIHFSLYVASKNNFVKNLFFEISSAGLSDAEELQWEIELSSIKEGWNEIYLSIPNGIKTGKIDYTEINFFRLYSPNLDTKKGSLDVIIDDICVTKKGRADRRQFKFVGSGGLKGRAGAAQ